MKKVLIAIVASLAVLVIGGCNRQAMGNQVVIDGETNRTTTTVAIAVTDDNEAVVTKGNGEIVTTYVDILPTRPQTVTNLQGEAQTKPNGETVTQVVIPSHIVVGTDTQGNQTTVLVTEQTVTTTDAETTTTQENTTETTKGTVGQDTTTTTEETMTTATTTTKKPTSSSKVTLPTFPDGWTPWV
ncbi:MAG: hypothetical protein J6Q42_01175 [Clostridia bacterium]|nr:hypothetical protein [Clostridia bacterium]